MENVFNAAFLVLGYMAVLIMAVWILDAEKRLSALEGRLRIPPANPEDRATTDGEGK